MNCTRCSKRLSRKTARQIDGAPVCSACLFAPAPNLEQFTCPDCHGEGWTQGTDYEGQCCGGSDWECGARGCTGPIQVQIPIQEQCEYCLGTGDVRARDSRSSPEWAETGTGSGREATRAAVAKPIAQNSPDPSDTSEPS